MRCPACDVPNPPKARFCIECGEKMPREPSRQVAAADEEEERRPRRRPARRRDDDDGGISTIIPYKNPQALFAYYCGIFAIIPVLGLLLSPIAIVLGIMGLLYKRANPEAKGTAHAVVGIVIGTLVLLAHVFAITLLILYRTRH